jgi:N-acetylglucosamine-6-phosphate deacetylase
LGEQTVTVDNSSARLASGTLAGSILSLDQAVHNLMAFTGASLAEVLPTVTSTPAKLLGLEGKGRLAPGCDADLVLLSPDGQVHLTVVGGEVVYSQL